MEYTYTREMELRPLAGTSFLVCGVGGLVHANDEGAIPHDIDLCSGLHHIIHDGNFFDVATLVAETWYRMPLDNPDWIAGFRDGNRANYNENNIWLVDPDKVDTEWVYHAPRVEGRLSGFTVGLVWHHRSLGIEALCKKFDVTAQEAEYISGGHADVAESMSSGRMVHGPTNVTIDGVLFEGSKAKEIRLARIEDLGARIAKKRAIVVEEGADLDVDEDLSEDRRRVEETEEVLRQERAKVDEHKRVFRQIKNEAEEVIRQEKAKIAEAREMVQGLKRVFEDSKAAHRRAKQDLADRRAAIAQKARSHKAKVQQSRDEQAAWERREVIALAKELGCSVSVVWGHLTPYLS